MSYTPLSNLVFSGVYTPSTELNFAQITTPVYELSISAVTDDVVGEFRLQTVLLFTVDAVLDNMAADVQLHWDSGVFRGVAAGVGSRYQTQINDVLSDILFTFNDTVKVGQELFVEFFDADTIYNRQFVVWRQLSQSDTNVTAGLRDAADTSTDAFLSNFISLPLLQFCMGSQWGISNFISTDVECLSSITYQLPKKLELFYNEADECTRQIKSGFKKGAENFTTTAIAWGDGNAHSWIWDGIFFMPEPVKPPPIPFELRFYQRQPKLIGGAILQFARPCLAGPLNTNLAALLGTYTIMVHTISVKRLPDLVNIPVLSINLQTDRDSWCWGCSLTVKTAEIMGLMQSTDGNPVKVRVEINSYNFVFLIEGWSESEKFGETVYTVSGRSALAELASPRSAARSYYEADEKVAAALIDNELQNTGWTASYHPSIEQLFTEQWLIPAGVFSYVNKTKLEAMALVAKAAGARLFADRFEQVLHIAPRYPVSPWDLSNAENDFSLPRSVWTGGDTQLTPSPTYNRVFVAGKAQGVLCSVTRTGTAGDNAAAMEIDDLLTHVSVGRERGRNILSGAGNKSIFTANIIVTESIGIIDPGLVGYVMDETPWFGLSTSVQVSAAHGSVRQSVEVERWYL